MEQFHVKFRCVNSLVQQKMEALILAISMNWSLVDIFIPRLETQPFAKSFMHKTSGRVENELNAKSSSKTGGQEEQEN